jgi:hypothetical protein
MVENTSLIAIPGRADVLAATTTEAMVATSRSHPAVMAYAAIVVLTASITTSAERNPECPTNHQSQTQVLPRLWGRRSREREGAEMTVSGMVRVSWVLAAAFFVVTGLWPLVSPETFFDTLVAFPPYNAHLMRDIGVFTLGVAGALLAAVRFKDALLVALIGASTAAIAHVVSHVVDSDKGGKPTDIPLLAVFAAVLVAGTAIRMKEVKSP